MKCDICKSHTYVVYVNLSHEKACGKCFDEQTETDMYSIPTIRKKQKRIRKTWDKDSFNAP